MAVTTHLYFVLLVLATYAAASNIPGCRELGQALDEVWQALPATASPNMGSYGFSKDRAVMDLQQTGLGGPGATISTQEGRHRLACLIAGVNSVQELVALFHNVPENEVISQYQNIQNIINNHNGVGLMEDAAELARLLNYILRKTGFPYFPLDIYDADMSLYLVNRVFSHQLALSTMIADAAIIPQQRVAEALMSQTAVEFQMQFGIRRPASVEQLRSYRDRIKIYTPFISKVANLVKVSKQIGLWDLP